MSDSDWQDSCHSCVGRERQQTEYLSPYAVNALLATLNDNPNRGVGDNLPPLMHWLYFNEPVKADQLSRDGHEKLGSFLPPVQYSSRMWAGSSIEFHEPILLGEDAQRKSTIKSVEFKTGSGGPLCFVNVEHRYSQRQRLCLIDTHTIVYRDHTTEKANSISHNGNSPAHTSRGQSIGSIVLFRYSAITFNSHRIHYDIDYCRDVEGYPGLVVHGPLMATLLARDILKNNVGASIANFSFRAHSPVFADDVFIIETRTQDGIACATLVMADGTKAMSAKASLTF